MVTRADDPVLNLTNPPIHNMVLLQGTLNGVNIGLSTPGPAVFTTTTINTQLWLPYIPTYSVLVGTGLSQPIYGISPGNAGFPLVSNGPNNYPTFGQLDIGSGAFGGILSVSHGGTGVGFMTPFAVLLGNGSNQIWGTGPVAAGYPLLSNGVGAFPGFGAIDLNGPGVGGVVAVPHGGTGVNFMTPFAVLLGNGTNQMWATGAGPLGTVLTSNGTTAFPSFQALPLVKLFSDTIYYVSTTGNDGNDGSSGNPWATMQHAADWIIANVIFNGHTITVQLSDGTYNQGLFMAGNVPGNLIFQGNNGAGAAGNVKISNTGNCFGAAFGAFYRVFSMQLTSSGAAGISSSFNGSISCKNIIFGNCAVSHLYCFAAGSVQVIGDIEIAGSAAAHAWADQGAIIFLSDPSLPTNDTNAPISFTPTFSTAFVVSYDNGVIYAPNNTWSLVANGPRFLLASNGVIDTAGHGASYFPGSSGGTGATESGGVYI